MTATLDRPSLDAAAAAGQPMDVASFVIYASWSSERAIDDTAQALFDSVFLPDDDEACSWIEPDAPRTLRLSFDVDADSYEAAIEVGRHLVTTASSACGLAGALAKVSALDFEGGRDWVAPVRGEQAG